MSNKGDKVQIQFIYRNKSKKTFELAPDYAKELEILASTGIPRRLTKAVLRIGNYLLKHNGEAKKNTLLAPSRSGDLYNALKYLINEGIIEKIKEKKTIKVIDFHKLNLLLTELNELLQK